MKPAPIKALNRPSIFCHAYFPNGKSRDFKAALRLAKRAAVYAERDEDGEISHVVGFSKTKKDARLCYLFLERVRHLKGHMVFIGGRPEKITWRILNVLDCYSKAMAVKNKSAYCRVEAESESLPFRKRKMVAVKGPELYTYVDDEDSPKATVTHCISPCKDLAPFLMLTRKTGDKLVDQVLATAEEHKQILCPLFDIEGFHEPIKAPPKYW